MRAGALRTVVRRAALASRQGRRTETKFGVVFPALNAESVTRIRCLRADPVGTAMLTGDCKLLSALLATITCRPDGWTSTTSFSSNNAAIKLPFKARTPSGCTTRASTRARGPADPSARTGMLMSEFVNVFATTTSRDDR